ncbi:hypothetical protein KAR91_71345 [Candidatus Pacearchaeota archaeon]|nr:hypothetical protein [Candidatus Pacearchaeota archaeon]
MREAQAIELLSRKVSDEGYLTIPQVANGTGGNARRTADALMVQTWPSRNLSITGVEYKCSRADWRRELKNGAKAEAIASYCHYWLVLAPKGIVPLDEVPGGWGLWEFDEKGRLLRTKPPPAQEDIKPLDLSFICAVLRAAEKSNRHDAVLEADREKQWDTMNDQINDRVKIRTSEFERLQKRVKVFEDASGLKISTGWMHNEIGEGVQKYLEDPERFVKTLELQRRSIQIILSAMNEALGETKT